MNQPINSRQAIKLCPRCGDFTIVTGGGPEKCRACLPRRESKEVIFSTEWRKKRLEILARDGYECFYCGERATAVDHKTPICYGGPETDENLVASCRRCNGLKHTLNLEQFRAKLKKLLITRSFQVNPKFRVILKIHSRLESCG